MLGYINFKERPPYVKADIPDYHKPQYLVSGIIAPIRRYASYALDDKQTVTQSSPVGIALYYPVKETGPPACWGNIFFTTSCSVSWLEVQLVAYCAWHFPSITHSAP